MAPPCRIAAHAIRLARIDPLVRAHVLDPEFESADFYDVEDLLAMLEIVPWDFLVDGETLLLNPTFGSLRLWSAEPTPT